MSVSDTIFINNRGGKYEQKTLNISLLKKYIEPVIIQMTKLDDKANSKVISPIQSSYVNQILLALNSRLTQQLSQFCLRWNDFENNISSTLRELRDDKDFFDVTLACDDEQIQAHKVILSASSPFFKSILCRNRHQHLLLYLNFMYHGEVNVAQEELNSFLAVAEDLKVKDFKKGYVGSNSKNKPATGLQDFTAQVIMLNHPGQVSNRYCPVSDCHTAHIAYSKPMCVEPFAEFPPLGKSAMRGRLWLWMLSRLLTTLKQKTAMHLSSSFNHFQSIFCAIKGMSSNLK